MQFIMRVAGVITAAAATTFATMPATHAVDPVTVEDRLDQIELVEDAAALSASPVERVSTGGEVSIDTGGATEIALDLPTAAGAKPTRSDGRYVLAGEGDSSLAVTPTESGAQILIGVASTDAPQSYEFGVGDGVTPQLRPDGAVDLFDSDGQLAAQVATPWAIDADGRSVPTRFTVAGGKITQQVDHAGGDFTYPIVADPNVKFCDLYTAVCVKFTKKETRAIANGFSSSVGAGVSTLCGQIPASNPAGIAVRAICVVAVNLYWNRIRKAFVKARNAGKCAEAKFRIIGPAIVTAKVVKC